MNKYMPNNQSEKEGDYFNEEKNLKQIQRIIGIQLMEN